MPPATSSPRTRPAKSALSRDAVVAAALAVVDEVGYEAASMRRIAQALDTGPASLYVYVADRHELMCLAYERALADVVLPGDGDGAWRGRLELLVGRTIDALAAHDAIASVALGDVPLGPESLRLTEEMSRLLRVGGVADAQIGWAMDLLGQYVASSALEGAVHRRTQRELAASTDDRGRSSTESMTAAMVARIQAVYDGLDPSRFPTLHALRGVLTGGGGDARAAWKLRILVDGLLAQG
jgi:AcrR family transcriptional regulator